MAFPTSGLTNNLVHKEGNRAFVYDSTLGVWDQVRETDRTENKILSGTIGSAVTFPVGHVLQVVTNSITSSASSSSTTFANTGLNASITPSSTSNKIVIQCQSTQYTNGNNHHLYSTIYRGSTHLGPSNEGFALWSAANDVSGRWNAVPMLHTDSPNTTSAVTYHIYFRVNSTSSTGYFNYGSDFRANITLMEIKV